MRFGLFIIILLAALPVQAQLRPASVTPSSPEDVAIAFYKTAGIAPSFSHWIKAQEPYVSTAPVLRSGVLEKERKRLLDKYSGFNPQTDRIIVRSDKFLKVNEGSSNYLVFNPDEISPTYLPFSYLTHHFALIPTKQTGLSYIDISEPESDFLSKTLKKDEKYIVFLEFLPQKAEIDRFYEIDGQNKWAFVVKLAGLTVWDQDGAFIWEKNYETPSLAP